MSEGASSLSPCLRLLHVDHAGPSLRGFGQSGRELIDERAANLYVIGNDIAKLFAERYRVLFDELPHSAHIVVRRENLKRVAFIARCHLCEIEHRRSCVAVCASK